MIHEKSGYYILFLLSFYIFKKVQLLKCYIYSDKILNKKWLKKLVNIQRK